MQFSCYFEQHGTIHLFEYPLIFTEIVFSVAGSLQRWVSWLTAEQACFAGMMASVNFASGGHDSVFGIEELLEVVGEGGG